MDWPPPLRYAVSLWVSLYLVVCLLTLINTAFVWDFYVVFAISFGLFAGVRLLLAVSYYGSHDVCFPGLADLAADWRGACGHRQSSLNALQHHRF